MCEWLSTPSTPTGSRDAKQISSAHVAEQRLRRRTSFDFWAALVYIAALNGTSMLKIFFILLINYKIATALPRNAVPLTTWVFNIGILFANELTQGYRYTSIGNALAPFVPSAVEWGKTLDSYGGLNPRWEVLFKITILRMISFNFDYYWSLDRSRAGSPIEVSHFSLSSPSTAD